MFLPCGGNLHHHLGAFKSDLWSVGLLVLNLSCINNHLLGHKRTCVSVTEHKLILHVNSAYASSPQMYEILFLVLNDRGTISPHCKPKNTDAVLK